MKDNKKSFIVYCDLIHTVKMLSDEQAGKVFKLMLEFTNGNDIDKPTDPMVALAFEPIKHQLLRDLEKYEERAERSRINGLKGGRPKNPEEPRKPSGLNDNLKEPRKPDNVNVIVTDIVSDNVIDNVNDTENVNDNDTSEVVFPFESEAFITAWNNWLEDRKERKIKKYTHRGEQGALHNLQKMSNDNEHTAIAIINQSITQGWQGLFPLKNQSNERNTNNELARLLADKYKD